MKNLKVGIKLPSSKEINAQLNKLLAKGYDIKLNGDSLKTSVSDITAQINKIREAVNSVNGNKINISTTIDKNGTSTVTTYKNSITETIKETERMGQVTKTVISQNLQAFNNLKNTLSQKLNTASGNNLIDSSTIDNLRVKLASLNTDSSVAEVNELKNAINSLSSTDSGIVRITNSIIKLESRIANVKDNKINLIDQSEIVELQQAENEVSKLRTLLSQLKNGDIIDGKKISSSINTATNSVRNLENSFKNVNTSAGSLTTTMSNIFSYAIGGSLIYGLVNEVKEGVSSIVELDTALRDLRKVSSLTTQQLSEFTKEASKIGTEIGSSTQSVITATEYYSKLGYAIEEAKERAKNATIFSNVADMNIDDASKALITIQKGFDLNTLEDMTKIMDVANEVGNNYSSSSKDVADGLLRMGNALYEAGNSYEQAVGIFVAGNASIQDADVVGNAIKTITMRLRGMETEIDATSVPVSKLRDEILQLTTDAGQAIDIMKDDNTFKSTYEQLTELAEVYPKLTDGQRAYLQYVIAGQRQGNIFSGIMQNMEEGISAYETALNSVGSSAKEQSIYMESIEGRLNEFKNTITELWVNSIDSDFIKGSVSSATELISVLSQMIEKFGILPTVTSVATASFVMFNSKFREMSNSMLQIIPGYGKLTSAISGYSDKLKVNIEHIQRQITYQKEQQAEALKTGASTVGMGAKMVKLNSQLAMTTMAMTACKIATIALNAVLTAGIGLLIGSAISGLTTLIDKAIVTKSELKSLNEEYLEMANGSAENVKSARELLSSYENVSKQLDELTNGTEAYKEKEAELNEIVSSLVSMYPEINVQLEENTNRKLLNVEATKSLIKTQENLLKAKSATALNQNDIKDINDVKELVEKYKDAQAEMEKFTQLSNEGVKKITEGEGLSRTTYYVDKYLEKSTEKYEDVRQKVETVLEALQNSGNTNLSGAYELLSDAFYNVADSSESAEDSINKMLGTASDTSEAEASVTLLQKAYEKLGYSAEDAELRVAELNNMSNDSKNAEIVKDATTAYGEAISKTKELDGLLKEINEEQSMTPELIMELAGKYPELGSRITDVASVQEFLNSKIQEQTKAQVEAYQIMVQNDQAYYNSKILNNEELNKNFQALCASFVDDQGNAYSIDLKNYTSLAQLKSKLTEDLGAGVADFITNFVTANAEGYSVDLNNTSSWASSKAKILQDLNTQIKKLEKNMSSALSKIQSDAYTGMKAGDSESEKLYTMASNQLKDAQAKYEEIQTEFSTYNKGFSSYTPSFSSGSFNTGSGSNNKGSSSSSKEVEDIQIETDRYYDLNNAINKVNDALEINDILSKNANDDAKLKYIKEEISLYNQKRQALEKLQAEQKKELSEIRNSLSGNGFTFDADGNISNLNSKLENLESWANSASGTEKENRQTTVKNIQSMIDSYKDLRDKISDINADILDINNTIIDAQKDIASILEEQRDNYIDNLEKETDALKKQLEKRKQLLQKDWDEEDYEDNLAEYQGKVNELESQLSDALRTGDQELIKSVREQIAEAQKELNDFIRDHERDIATDRIDSEMDILDEDLEAKIEEINNKLSDEQILQLVQSGVTDLNSTLDNIANSTKSITSTFATVGTIISDNWIGNLETFKDKLQSISMTLPNISFNTVGEIATRNSGVTSIKGGDVIIKGDIKEDVLPKVESMIEESNRKLVQDLNNIIGRR